MAVDIGCEAIDRESALAAGYTLINKTNPATVSGEVTSVDIAAAGSTINGLRVGTFYTINGDTLKCRDSEAIPGTIPANGHVTKAVSLAVEIGDYIGCYYTSGSIEWSLSGLQGLWYWYGVEKINPGDEWTYSIFPDDGMSLGGYITPTITIVEGSAAGEGIGLASSSAKLDILAQALGNGIGLSQSSPYLIIPASARGEGIGLGTSSPYLIIPASASGNGIGLGQATGEIVIIILAQAAGSGIGEATAQAFRIVVLTYEEFAALEARIAELELALEPKAHFRV